MDNHNKWKMQQATSGLKSFFDQFGEPDIYTKIVLEVLFEEIYGQKKTVSVSGSERQERDSSSNSISNQ